MVQAFLLEMSLFSFFLPYLVSFGNLFLILLFLPITKWVLDTFTVFDDDVELTEKDNVAFSLTRAAEYLAVILIIAGSLYGSTESFAQMVHESKVADATATTTTNAENTLLWSILTDYFYNFLWAGIGLILLILTKYFFINKCLFPYFSIAKEIINDQNPGAGAVEASALISVGIIIACAISGENLAESQFSSEILNHPFVLDLISALFFWICGCFILWIFSRLYEKTIGYSLHQEIEKDNISAGVSFAFNLVAIAIIIGKGLAGNFVSYWVTLEKFFFNSVLGFFILLFFRLLIDRILLPDHRMADEIVHDQNLSVSFIEGFISVGIAIVLFFSL